MISCQVKSKHPLIVILGPTASGKSDYAIKLAQLTNGEIICGDSRTVYQDMNIGTAKPTDHQRSLVPHWGLDLVPPSQSFNLHDFQLYTKEEIADIRSRHKTPFLVGGSGLYIDSIIYNYQLANNSQSKTDLTSQQLSAMNRQELVDYINSHNIEMPADPNNERRLRRAIEVGGVNRARSSLMADTIVIGIATDRAVLTDRIRARASQMLHLGLIDETIKLQAKYGDCEPIRRNLYGAVADYLAGKITSKEQLIDRMVTVDRQLAKKQLTWWRKPYRAKDIWWCSLDSLYNQLATFQKEGWSDCQIIDYLVSEYKIYQTNVLSYNYYKQMGD